MKKLIPLLIMLTFLSGQDSKLKITILDLDGPEIKGGILKACFGRLESTLINSGRFIVIEKSKREEILKEAEWQNSGNCDTDCAVEIGGQIGADYIVFGSLTYIQRSYHQIDLKIVDIEEGEAIEAVTEDAKGDFEVLLETMEEASREIVRRIATGGDANPIIQKPGITLAEKKYSDVLVESIPSGAIVMIDGNEKGFTPVQIEKVEVGTRSLMLIKPGYETLSKGIIINEGKITNVSEVLVPKTGSLTVLSSPVGGMVYIEGVPKGPTPIDLKGLKVKDYIVDIELENYRKVTQRVTVQYNENTTQKFQLEPLPGLVNAIIDPVAALVTVDGEKYKSSGSGITKIPLPVGKHRLKITSEGYEPQTKIVTVGPNQSVAVEINLKKKPAGISSNPNIGFLTVHSANKKVKLKISRVRGFQELPIDYYELKYGVYNLKAFKDGYESYKKTVTIKKQQTEKLKINLQKKSVNKALKYSLYFPGGGQIYAGTYQRGLLYSVSSLAMGALIGQGIETLRTEKNLMDQYYSNYQSATTPNQINSTWNTYNSQVNLVNDKQTQIKIFTVVLFSSWITSIIDAYYFTGLR